MPNPTIELNWIYTSSGEYLGGAIPAMVVESPEHYPARTFTVTIHAEEEAHEDERECKEKNSWSCYNKRSGHCWNYSLGIYHNVFSLEDGERE